MRPSFLAELAWQGSNAVRRSAYPMQAQRKCYLNVWVTETAFSYQLRNAYAYDFAFDYATPTFPRQRQRLRHRISPTLRSPYVFHQEKTKFYEVQATVIWVFDGLSRSIKISAGYACLSQTFLVYRFWETLSETSRVYVFSSPSYHELFETFADDPPPWYIHLGFTITA